MTKPDSDPVYLKALEWFVLMKDEKASDEDRRSFGEWIDASPEHRDAYERALSLWARFDIVAPEFEKLRRKRLVTRRKLLAGGAVALAGAPAAYWATRPERFADFVTGIGERRSFRLDDGSEVELGSRSALSVDYAQGLRRLVLFDGQAYFDVAADPARPFVVEAGSGSVRALGTQFDVKRSGGEVSVTVARHSVLVKSATGSPVNLDTGWQVSYGAGASEPREVDVAGVIAWRRDRIVFEGAPLRIVLRELERYRRGPIYLADRSIGDMSVTAVFDTKEADAALNTIARALPVRLVDLAGYVAVIYRR